MIPAGTSLTTIARDTWIKDNFPAVHIAAAEAATPQIRNVGTLAGNLCQHTRCWYFRTKTFSCTKRGDATCDAKAEGADTRHLAIFQNDACASAHGSNLAPALIAVRAMVHTVHPEGGRKIDAGLLHEAHADALGDTVLRPGELIRAVELVPSALARRSTYVEFRERASFDFAVASVAAALELDDAGKVKDVRIVCGGVAPTPHRAVVAEDAIRGKALDPAAAAKAAVAGARPLAGNRFKVVILERLIRRALEELGGKR
jgi:xanthine dehydrogenase YagS FAD-binding subunit